MLTGIGARGAGGELVLLLLPPQLARHHMSTKLDLLFTAVDLTPNKLRRCISASQEARSLGA